MQGAHAFGFVGNYIERTVHGETTTDGKRLAERPHQNIDIRGYAEMLASAVTAGAHYTRAVCIVDDAYRAMLTTQRNDAIEWRKIAVHRVHAFDSYENI